jgi:hypothetical protein
MARSNLIRMQVQQDIYDPKSMLDEQNWYNTRNGGPSDLSMKLTYLLGDNTRNFPLAMATYGNIIGDGKFKKEGNVKELDDIQYTYPTMSRSDKASVVADTIYTTGDKPGIGHSTFEIPFTDNWIKRHYIIESEREVQVYVTKDLEFRGEYWYATVQLDPALPTDYCDISQLQAGCRWSEMNTVNAESESTGTEFKRVAPGKVKNQMGIVRLSHSWAGNASEKVMKIMITVPGKGTTNLWMDLEVWQFEKRWLEEVENSLWYSRYNRQVNGTIALKELLTGKVIPRGSGLLEQIPNYSTYSRLTYNKLQNTMTDALFGQSDTDDMTITLHTGTGGFREFDRVMKEQGATVIGSFGNGNVADKFITGSGYNLALGGYFDTMYHIDGYLVKVKKNKIFDNGRRAMKSPPHPETGLPLESYRMVFIDDSDYDGEPNLVHVSQKGRQFLHGMVQGLTNAPRTMKLRSGGMLNEAEVKQISSDQDKASYHCMGVFGIQIKRATKCFHLECVAGL